MPNEQAQAVQYTPFGTPIRKERFIYDGISQRKLAQFGLELDKETGSTKVVEKDPIDLFELIQSYKDECGMEAAQRLIARGLASPDDFAAQPVDYGDTSQLPDNINDAYQQNLKNQQLGVDLSQFKSTADIDAYVTEQVKKELAKAQAQAQQQIQTQTQTQNDGGSK